MELAKNCVEIDRGGEPIRKDFNLESLQTLERPGLPDLGVMVVLNFLAPASRLFVLVVIDFARQARAMPLPLPLWSGGFTGHSDIY